MRCHFPEPPVSVDRAKQPVPALSGSPASVLTVRNLAASYGPVTVLRDVSFDVTAGRCTAVVGQSGSGKTTLARSLVGLHTDWTGDVELSGTKLSADPRRRSKEDRRVVQYVFQNPYGSLNPRMTVRENLEEPLRYFFDLSRSARRREGAMRYLQTVALVHRIRRAPATAVVWWRAAAGSRGAGVDCRPGSDGLRRDHLGAGCVGAGVACRATAAAPNRSWACRWFSSRTTSRSCAASPRTLWCCPRA